MNQQCPPVAISCPIVQTRGRLGKTRHRHDGFESTRKRILNGQCSSGEKKLEETPRGDGLIE
jgi:hypothetical protein